MFDNISQKLLQMNIYQPILYQDTFKGNTNTQFVHYIVFFSYSFIHSASGDVVIVLLYPLFQLQFWNHMCIKVCIFCQLCLLYMIMRLHMKWNEGLCTQPTSFKIDANIKMFYDFQSVACWASKLNSGLFLHEALWTR